jgi:MraZ protein
VRATNEVGVSIRGIYQGYALQQVDEKGRVAIPSSLRATLVARSARELDPKEAAQIVIALHESDTCLVGYDVPQGDARFAALEARARAHAGPDGAPNDEILRRGMAWDTLPFDASGRFIFPSFPRKRAKIGKYAFFYGLGSHFEIWDPAQIFASSRADTTMREMVAHFLEERGEKL